MNALSNDHLFKVIKDGGISVGKSPLMAAWGSALTDQQIRDVIAYIRSIAIPPYRPKDTRARDSGVGETIIGEWNDNVGSAWRHNIKIVREGDRFFRVSLFGDGGIRRGELREQKAKIGQQRSFLDLSTERGEVYVIDADGNLELFDNEGFIREARPAN